MALRLLRPLAALCLLLITAGPALAWTEFHLTGLTPNQRYTLRISSGATFGQWAQKDPKDLKVKSKELSFIATDQEAVLRAVVHPSADTVLGTLAPWRGVKGTIKTPGHSGTLANGTWLIAFPGAPPTCTGNPNCPTEFCPPGQKCYSWQGKWYCCWLDPDRIQ